MSIVVRPNVTKVVVQSASTKIVRVSAVGPQGPKGDPGDDGAGVDTFLDLTDTPGSYGTAGFLVGINPGGDALIFIDPASVGGAGDFTDLGDTPGTITANGWVRGNPAGDALIFSTITAADVSGLATVATTGSFDDLIDVPTEFNPAAHTHDASEIISGTFDDARISESSVTQHEAALTIAAGQVTGLATVAITGAYSDLTGTPTIPSSFLDLADTPGVYVNGSYLRATAAALVFTATIPAADVSGLAAVATSGSFEDLNEGQPLVADNYLQVNAAGDTITFIATIPASDISGLGAVATSNSYNDLDDLPSLVGTSSDNEILYNNGGVIDGVPAFEWDGTNLDLPNITRINDGANQYAYQIRGTGDERRGISFFSNTGNPAVRIGVDDGTLNYSGLTFTDAAIPTFSLGGEGSGEIFTLQGSLTITSGDGISISNNNSETLFEFFNQGGSFIFQTGFTPANTAIELGRQSGGSITIATSTGAGDYTLTLPTDDGTSGQVLSTDGSGVLSWVDQSGGASSLNDLSDVTITTPATGNLLRYNGSVFVNTNLVAADIPNLDTSKITTGTFADARISQSSVTQHQAALTIGAGQVTGLSDVATSNSYNDLDDLPTLVTSLDDLSDVTLTSGVYDIETTTAGEGLSVGEAKIGNGSTATDAIFENVNSAGNGVRITNGGLLTLISSGEVDVRPATGLTVGFDGTGTMTASVAGSLIAGSASNGGVMTASGAGSIVLGNALSSGSLASSQFGSFCGGFASGGTSSVESNGIAAFVYGVAVGATLEASTTATGSFTGGAAGAFGAPASVDYTNNAQAALAWGAAHNVTTAAPLSATFGLQADARAKASLTIGAGQYSGADADRYGAAQRVASHQMGRTTSATPVRGSIDNAGADLTIEDGGALRLKFSVVAKEEGTDRTAYYEVVAGVRRGSGAGTTTIDFQNTTTDFENADLSGCDVVAAVDTSTGEVYLSFTGVASRNIRWYAAVDIAELKAP